MAAVIDDRTRRPIANPGVGAGDNEYLPAQIRYVRHSPTHASLSLGWRPDGPLIMAFGLPSPIGLVDGLAGSIESKDVR